MSKVGNCRASVAVSGETSAVCGYQLSEVCCVSDPRSGFLFLWLASRSSPVGTVDAVTVVSCCKNATFSIQGIRLKVFIQKYCHNHMRMLINIQVCVNMHNM